MLGPVVVAMRVSAGSIAGRVTSAERAVVGARGVRSDTAGAVSDVNIAGLVVVADICCVAARGTSAAAADN